jgi:hypothetical protein
MEGKCPINPPPGVSEGQGLISFKTHVSSHPSILPHRLSLLWLESQGCSVRLGKILPGCPAMVTSHITARNHYCPPPPGFLGTCISVMCHRLPVAPLGFQGQEEWE